MDKFVKFSFVFMVLGLIGACSATPETTGGESTSAALQEFTPVPEVVKGKQDVYASMARTVKYNVDKSVSAAHQKILNSAPGYRPQDLIQTVMNVKDGRSNPLYDSIRALDYAVIYALANLSGDPVKIEENLYAKTAQSLALAAIKAHKDALYASKQIKETSRLIDKEQKKLTALNLKLERNGMLSPADLTYKKALEVALLKLKEIRDSMAAGAMEYAALAKVEPKDLKLEGKIFYELDDLDKKLTVNAFQKSAFYHRSEFGIAREMGRSANLKDVEYNLIKKYPEIERLNINGYDVENQVYAENLEKRAYHLAMSLADKVEAYVKAGTDMKPALRVKAYDELGLAVFTQVELAYNLVRLSEIDYVVTAKQVSDLKKDIKQREYSRRAGTDIEINILNDKVKLLELENRLNEISGEKAIALRALYFYAGFSPFNKTLLGNEIKDISSALKTAFNRDMVQMLATVPPEENVREEQKNEWAKKENWLEELMDNKPAAPEKIIMPISKAPEDDFSPYTDASYNGKKIMQLGSYVKRDNADLEWKMLQELYPEFRSMKPEVIRTRVNGTIMFRLILRSESGGFMEICNKLRGNRVECLLR